MVRETRHLWVGNLPDNIREDKIREHFKRYGRVQSVKLLPRVSEEKTGEVTMACTVAFMDIKSASKAHNTDLKIDDRILNTEYYEPAAIPSAASPQGTPSPYSTSPGSTRFPNGHGSSDEPCFPDTGSTSTRFYERPTLTGGGVVSRPADTCDVPRRSAATPAPEAAIGTCRGRNRHGDLQTGGHRPWPGYESSRYNNSNAGSQSETGYNSAPSESNERRDSDKSVRKKTKSKSGSQSPSPSGSLSSRSPSRSRSRSSSSSSSSSTSRDTTSTSSPRSRGHYHQNSSISAQDGTDDRRPLAICVRNLPLRSSDTSLKDGLFHEYKKHGKVTWVKVVGQSADRHAIVCFKKPEDAEKALEVSYDKLFFGCKIEVAPYILCEVDDGDLRYEAEIDEYHPKATRTLFIGNLEKDVTASDLRKHFDQFGEIIEIDIKKQGAVSSYAFCQYSDIVSVVKAIRKMDGEHMGNNRIKLGFGKSMAYNCVWIDGVNESVNEKYLRMQFEPFGVISRCIIDREKGQALIFYEHVSHAQLAVSKMRGFVLKNTKLQVDFASRECQECFFERLEKQGTVLDRATFDDRRDSASRSFEASASSRITRYDTPTRPRTSSYSSRSSVAPVASPGTPGSATPRAGRSRVSRYYDYDLDYVAVEGRHISHRSYDEYSQGSAASLEDTYEHGPYLHDSPGHLDPLEVRVAQNLVDAVPYAPHDIRNLQKERVHLLEQLEDCPSSGDELISPKKRLKLDLLDPTSDVIIEANRDHRKVMEVRRTSESALRHHSRRPSVDSKYSHYVPHVVGCKRRRTGGSDGGTRSGGHSHYAEQLEGSENESSRPGTPLCDEKPEFPTGEPPKRTTREREGPLMLPLPKFAAQVIKTIEFQKGTVTVAGIKGQKDLVNPLASPPPAATSPRIFHPRPPSPIQVAPPPASPPPRPPSLSSNSSDSDATSPSPSLEDRIRSLDEKYEKWSGSRAISAAGNDALVLLDANREKFRLRHKLLEIQDLKEVQPSEIVKSVMAKRSVFDEDLKRLESVGEKYEPKEFGFFTSRMSSLPCMSVPATLLPTSPVKLASIIQLPKTPTVLSPRSTATSIPAAKGLQYPFPSHPPMQMSPALTLQIVPTSIISATVVSAPTTLTSTTATAWGPNHGETRLKSCACAPGDSRTSSVKVNSSRSTVVSLPQLQNFKNNDSNAAVLAITPAFSAKIKSSDTVSEKIAIHRDSNGSSPQADIKTRRNSDNIVRRVEGSERLGDNLEKTEDVQREQRLSEKAKEDQKNNEKGQQEKEQVEYERLEKEKQEKENLVKEHAKKQEKERLERESELEKQLIEKHRLEEEWLQEEKETQEKNGFVRIDIDRNDEEMPCLDRESLGKEKLLREKVVKEKMEDERIKRQKPEQDRLQQKRDEFEKNEEETQNGKETEEQRQKESDCKECVEKSIQDRSKSEPKEKEKKERPTAEREKGKDKKLEEESSKHNDENHQDRSKNRENHSESRSRETHMDKHFYEKFTKEKDERCFKESHEIQRRDSHYENARHDKVKYILEREAERRKESIKENRDNNIYDKHKNLIEAKDHRDRAVVETRHMSLDLDKSHTYDSVKDPNKRKERNNSLPANLCVKRRMSSHESTETNEESKKLKISHDQKKISGRRDSKDSSKSEDALKKTKYKNNYLNLQEKHNDAKQSEEKRKDKEREDRHRKHKLEKLKFKSKSKENESKESPSDSPNSLTDRDFLARLNLRSNDDIECEKRKKEKRKEIICDFEKQDEKRYDEKLKKDNMPSFELKNLSKPPHEDCKFKIEERKTPKKERIRKITNTSDSDSDEPKKHSIFDIIDDEPAYISMYDKVKARSCKNMQKHKEEKRQEKIKAKFSQLKLSRARREEKKRSTSWDEDSDSEKESEIKSRRCRKVLESSDESQDQKHHNRNEHYSDSDNSILRHIKSEPAETTDDESKTKNSLCLKSRIASDTSDDEYHRRKISNQIVLNDYHEKKIHDQMSELFLENPDIDVKPDNIATVKNELEELVKKEIRNRRFLEFPSAEEQQILVDLRSEIPETKSEECNSCHMFDNTSEDDDDDDNNEAKKEKTERREKKHKKKQKKQKLSPCSDESVKIEFEYVGEFQEKLKHSENRKDHGKKEKKRDKTRERETRDKCKRLKKIKCEDRNDSKRDGKMENIFGSLSEESDNGTKDFVEKDAQNPVFLIDKGAQQPHDYITDSEKELYNMNKDERVTEYDRDDHKRRKEKRRREKERRFQVAIAEAAAAAASEPPNSNDSSMDFADMGKQLEANIKDDGSEVPFKTVLNTLDNLDTTNLFGLTDREIQKEKEERKDGKEKKKKRKKSKEEKKHHHHHHHDKNKLFFPGIKQDLINNEVNIENQGLKSHSQSLPSILDIQSPTADKLLTNFSVSPSAREIVSIISPIPNTPTTSKENKREKLPPGFGPEIEEIIHKNVVKSISTECKPVLITEEPTIKDDTNGIKLADPIEDKPRVVISQEETEDAVAALLGESFGSSQFEERYTEVISNTTEEVVPSLTEENNVQDDEEMRQAVQSLSVATDLDVKPETPQSEHELQIDTDTEEQEEGSVEQLPKTSETPMFSHDSKTADTNYFSSNKSLVKASLSPVAYKPIGSPPSLTLFKQSTATVEELKKNIEEQQNNLPIVPDHQRSDMSQSWPNKKKQIIISNADVASISEDDIVSKTLTQPAMTSLNLDAPTLKITEPLETISTKLSSSLESKAQTVPNANTSAKSPTISQHHNLPACSPVQVCKPSIQDGMLSPKSSANIPVNRLSITPILMYNPLQTSTMILPQPKVAQLLEDSTSDSKSHDRPRTLFQTSGIPPYTAFAPGQPTKMLVQSNVRHLPSTNLLVPTRNLNSSGYSYMENISQSTYSSIAKDVSSPVEKNQDIINMSQCFPTNINDPIKPSIVKASSKNPHSPTSPAPKTPTPTSSYQQLMLPSSKPYIPGQSLGDNFRASLSPVITEPLISAPSLSESQHLGIIHAPVNPKSPETLAKLIKDPIILPIPSSECKTLTPRPVIVSNPDTENESYLPALPLSTKLAIEKVTEELNMSLKKESEIKDLKAEEKAKNEVDKSKNSNFTDKVLSEFDVELPQSCKQSEESKVDTAIKEKSKQLEIVSTDSLKPRDKLSKEDSLDIREDSNYWTGKEVCTDSVIKTLCLSDELPDSGGETEKEKDIVIKSLEVIKEPEMTRKKEDELYSELKVKDKLNANDDSIEIKDLKSECASSRGSVRRRGRGVRARGNTRGGNEQGGILTRRGKLKEEAAAQAVPQMKRSRGGKTRNERISNKSESDSKTIDIYDFRDDSDDSNKEQRPRLVLTIKSATSSTNNSQTTAVVKEVTKDGAKEIGKETKEVSLAKNIEQHKGEFTSPLINTRKSRRLAEKDISKNTVDETIEDVVKNTSQIRAGSNQRRSSRQNINKTQVITTHQQESPRKSPRGRKPRRPSEVAEISSSEDTAKKVDDPKTTDISSIATQSAPIFAVSKKSSELEKDASISQEQYKEKRFEGLKAAMLRRIKGEMTNTTKPELTNLIDPVTGLLTPMRECEEGKYIPLPGSSPNREKKGTQLPQQEPALDKSTESVKTHPSIIAQPHQLSPVQQHMPKMHPLKAHVLSSQVAKAVPTQQPTSEQANPNTALLQQSQSVVVLKPMTPVLVTRSGTPLSQNVNINTSVNLPIVRPLSPRPGIPIAVTSKPQVKPPVLSPSQQLISTNQKPCSHVNKQQPTQQIPKALVTSAILSQQTPVVNAHISHMRHQPVKQKHVIIGKGSITKSPHSLHQQHILTGNVASPPLSKSQANIGNSARIIQGSLPPGAKGGMDPPKVDVNLSSVILGRASLSPQGAQSRLAGLPSYEASLHGDARAFLNRSRSPPPAHQNSPSPKGESISHFPPGPLRPPTDLNPAHYMHPTHAMQYQQFLRQQQLQQHLHRSSGMDKTGEEGEEAIVSLPLSGRSAAVPHSLHSPHDRATESPQIGQVYNTLPHSTRLQPYHPGTRCFEKQPAEPPPAHRPLTSHDRAGLAHVPSLGTPDRSLSVHLASDRQPLGTPDRPIGTHLSHDRQLLGTPDRPPISAHAHSERTHGLIGTGLGAAGNIMGAVAKHIGADAPTSQRGVQAATPPHASQVPPQAESLFMLLKHYPLMWQGLLALKNDQAAVQMYFVSGNNDVAKCSLPKNNDGSTPPLRIFQRMRLEPPQVEGVARKMQMENEHCMLLALPCGHDHMDVLKQSTNLTNGFITYLQLKQAAGIVNVAAPGTTQPPAYVVHIFPSCDFVNENLRRIAPSLLERVADIAHLLIVITTV